MRRLGLKFKGQSVFLGDTIDNISNITAQCIEEFMKNGNKSYTYNETNDFLFNTQNTLSAAVVDSDHFEGYIICVDDKEIIVKTLEEVREMLDLAKDILKLSMCGLDGELYYTNGQIGLSEDSQKPCLLADDFECSCENCGESISKYVFALREIFDEYDIVQQKISDTLTIYGVSLTGVSLG